MEFGDFRSVLGENEDEVHRICPGDRAGLYLLNRIWLVRVFRGTFEDRLEAWGVLKLFISVGILASLKRRDRVVCP